MKSYIYVLVSALVTFATRGSPISLDCDSKATVQFRSLQCSWSLSAPIPNSVIVLPFIDGLQWGADLTYDNSSLSGAFKLPLPQSPGSHTLQLAACPFSTVAALGPTVEKSVSMFSAQSLSNSISVAVTAPGEASSSPLPTVEGAPLVGLDWEPWFTPHNFDWAGGVMTAEAIPSVGRYSSTVSLPILQHLAWVEAAGADFLFVDWSNNLWGKTAWSQRNPNVQELVNATQLTMGVYAAERRARLAAGRPRAAASVPRFAFLLGLDNGPETTQQAIFEELDFMYEAMVANASVGAESFVTAPQSDAPGAPRLPLAVVFDGTGANHSDWRHPHFALRFMASQLQQRPSIGSKLQYWSWMDGAANPVLARRPDGSAEVGTAASAYFAGDGWTGPGAAGHEGGLTLLRTALSIYDQAAGGGGTRSQPGAAGPQPANLSFVLVNQWNEFAGQKNGGGYGPQHDRFVDSYSAELTNDMEPTDLAACGYQRPNTTCGGYGYRQLNLLRLAAAMLKAGPAAALGNSTVLLPTAPATGAVLAGRGSVNVTWAGLAAGGTGGARFVPVDGAVLSFSLGGRPVTPAASGPGFAVIGLPKGERRRGGSAEGDWARAEPATILRTEATGASGLVTSWPLSLQDADWGAGPGGEQVPAQFELALHLD